MKKIIVCALSLFLNFLAQAQLETFHDFSAVTITGDTISMSQYAGKKVMVVNTATFCGFTNQYAGLVTLDSLYGSGNFVLLGFPCNDFGSQEPFDDSTIWDFAHNTYGVKFQMMHKISITAFDTLEVYKWLQLQSRNGVADAPVIWNFNKFLIDELGHWVAHYTQFTTPLDTVITNWITASPTGVVSINKPMETALLQNPVNDKIQLRISSTFSEKVCLNIFDLKGTIKDCIFSGIVSGEQTVIYSTQKLDSGIYFLKLTGDSVNETLKVAVVK
jgi:glutathione peroxidase